MIETPRLILRQWQTSDFKPFAALNADPVVMRFFPHPLSETESNALAEQIHQLIAKQGWGFWAVALKSNAEFIGFTGLHQHNEANSLPHAPFIEIGWRLAAKHWGKAYAPEAAQAALRYAFNTLAVPEVYAFTALINKPSQRVMEKIGMMNLNEDFNHPKVAKGHILERHCLYRKPAA